MKRLLLLMLVACSKTPEPTPEPKNEAPPPAATSAKPTVPTAAGDKEIAWDAPSAWQSMPNPTTMRKATYKVGDETELTVSTATGGVEPNVKRWGDQFGAEPKSEKRKVNGLDVTIVEIKGSYQGMGGPKKDGYMLLGAVVETGAALTFFKMTGPEKVVTGAKPDFEKLVASLRSKS